MFKIVSNNFDYICLKSYLNILFYPRVSNVSLSCMSGYRCFINIIDLANLSTLEHNINTHDTYTGLILTVWVRYTVRWVLLKQESNRS